MFAFICRKREEINPFFKIQRQLTTPQNTREDTPDLADIQPGTTVSH